MLSWARGLVARYRLGRALGVWYHPGYAPSGIARPVRVVNLELDRAALVLEALSREGVLPPRRVRSAEPVSRRDLLRVHPASYLQRAATDEEMARVFGIEPGEIDADVLFMAQRLAVGGTMAAAESVLADDPLVCAVNLGGGFHHAQPELGSGFCVLNDVAVAIERLRSTGGVDRVAIVDLDFHQGDGNIVAFAHDSEVLTYSIHGSTWTHVEAVANRSIWLPSGTNDGVYLATLRRTLAGALAEHAPDLVFYLAGTDVLASDRLGDFRLTPAGVLERDLHVINTARAQSLPLVITLAGGYSEAAWQCTANMVRYLLTGQTRARAVAPPDVGERFRQVFQELDPAELQRSDDDFNFNEEDLFGDLGPRRSRRLVLDFYSTHGVEYGLEAYGILQSIRARGFRDLHIEVDPSDAARQLVRISGQADTGGPRHLLMELVARRQWIEAPAAVADTRRIELLGVEWLLLQDPTADFTLARPRLPGQEHPGLGLAREIIEMLLRICDRLGLEGVLNRPAYLHTAVGVSPGFHFIDPAIEGLAMALRQVTRDLSVADASNLVEAGQARLADDTPVPWQPADHVRPVSERLTRYFESESYVAAAQAEAERLLHAGLTCRAD